MQRKLLLTENEFGGNGDETFLVPWIIWTQLKTMFAKNKGIEIADDSVDVAIGEKFNDWIRANHDNLAAVVEANPDEFTTDTEVDALGWMMLLQLWDDESGELVGGLGYFLAQSSAKIEDENA